MADDERTPGLSEADYAAARARLGLPPETPPPPAFETPGDLGRSRELSAFDAPLPPGMPGGEAQFMLCGQYLAAQAAGEAKWMYFSTIRTSGYEQLIGSQPVGLCQGSSIIWATRGDLSSALQSRLDSLR